MQPYQAEVAPMGAEAASEAAAAQLLAEEEAAKRAAAKKKAKKGKNKASRTGGQAKVSEFEICKKQKLQCRRLPLTIVAQIGYLPVEHSILRTTLLSWKLILGLEKLGGNPVLCLALRQMSLKSLALPSKPYTG